jgi:hypothetical protein
MAASRGLPKNGHSSSCGCLRLERIVEKHTKHGHNPASGRSRTYSTWDGMLQRCTNPNNSKFHLYGGRGITVDPSWRDFRNFLQDMGERPPGKTLDRIEVN